MSGTEPDAVHELEPSRVAMEAMLRDVARFAMDHLDGLATAPVVGALGAEGRRIASEVSRPIPEEPVAGGLTELLADLERAVAASLNTAGPGYLAYIPGGGIHSAALADYASNCFNRFTGLSAAAPGLARLEADVLRWLAEEFGYGAEARGLLTSGGSLANLAAVVTAREELLGPDADLRLATAYTSGQTHHSVLKCLRLAGIPAANLRQLPVNAEYRLDVDTLVDRVQRDRSEGKRPFLVVAAAGTTNTGAVDPLPELADACERDGLWLHVDGAYGAAFVLCAEGREALRGIERAHSITFDPHKGMFLPYGTGCLLVRDGETLRRAHAEDANYLQDFDSIQPGDEIPNPSEHGPELSRDYRGLRLWLPLMLHGAGAFRRALEEKMSLARHLHDGLVQLIDRGAAMEIVAAPQLSIVAFRLRRGENEPLESWNARNAELNRRVVERGSVYLSSTSLPVEDGAAFTLRACVLSFRTHRDRVDALLDDLAHLVAEGLP